MEVGITSDGEAYSILTTLPSFSEELLILGKECLLPKAKCQRA